MRCINRRMLSLLMATAMLLLSVNPIALAAAATESALSIEDDV